MGSSRNNPQPTAFAAACGKWAYGTRRQAKNQERRARTEGGDHLNAYRCPRCHLWHLGHSHRTGPDSRPK